MARSGRLAAAVAASILLLGLAGPAHAQIASVATACGSTGSAGTAAEQACSNITVNSTGDLDCPAACTTAFQQVGQQCIDALASDSTTQAAYTRIFQACSIQYTASNGTAASPLGAPALAPLADAIEPALAMAPVTAPGEAPAPGLFLAPDPAPLSAAPGEAEEPNEDALSPDTAPAADADVNAPAPSTTSSALAPSSDAPAPAPQAAGRNAGMAFGAVAATSVAFLVALA